MSGLFQDFEPTRLALAPEREDMRLALAPEREDMRLALAPEPTKIPPERLSCGLSLK